MPALSTVCVTGMYNVFTSDVDRLGCSNFTERRVCEAGNVFTVVVIVEPDAK